MYIHVYTVQIKPLKYGHLFFGGGGHFRYCLFVTFANKITKVITYRATINYLQKKHSISKSCGMKHACIVSYCFVCALKKRVQNILQNSSLEVTANRAKASSTLLYTLRSFTLRWNIELESIQARTKERK